MELNRYASDYGADVTEVSFSYLLQLVATLREYGEYLVLVGGWVPYFLLKNYMKSSTEFTHIGSVDIDLAVDPRLFSDSLDRYRTIIEHIERLGYAEKRDRLDNVVGLWFRSSTTCGAPSKLGYSKHKVVRGICRKLLPMSPYTCYHALMLSRFP